MEGLMEFQRNVKSTKTMRVGEKTKLQIMIRKIGNETWAATNWDEWWYDNLQNRSIPSQN